MCPLNPGYIKCGLELIACSPLALDSVHPLFALNRKAYYHKITMYVVPPMLVCLTHDGPRRSPTRIKLPRFRPVLMRQLQFVYISHVSEDDEITSYPLSARALVLKGLNNIRLHLKRLRKRLKPQKLAFYGQKWNFYDFMISVLTLSLLELSGIYTIKN